MCLQGFFFCRTRSRLALVSFWVGRATWELLLWAVTALCYKNTCFSVLRSCASMPTGEMWSDEGKVTLRSSSQREAEGKEQPPSSSHKVKKQAKVQFHGYFSAYAVTNFEPLRLAESLFWKWQGHESTQTSLLFNESVVQIIKGFRNWQESSTYGFDNSGLITLIFSW